MLESFSWQRFSALTWQIIILTRCVRLVQTRVIAEPWDCGGLYQVKPCCS